MLEVRSARLAVAALLALLSVLVVPGAAAADHDTQPCADVTLVFARGSGQPLGAGEAARFFASTTASVGGGLRVNAYEVGTEPHGGAVYPAVGVGTDTAQSFLNLVGAELSWTALGAYNSSVAAGVTETAAYLAGRAARCPGERFVAGGYSQGAQVVGSALFSVAQAVRARIAFTGLFGDPKLYLPEGRGFYPPACRGSGLSPWRRGSVGCLVDNGILEARVPYVPADVVGRVGSWCDRNDPICTNNLLDFAVSTHDRYDLPGNGIDQAAREAAAALARPAAATAASRAVATGRTAAGGQVALAMTDYRARPGDRVTFAVAATYLDRAAVAYRWDFDGDGRVDRVTATPRTSHVYPRRFTGRAGLEVRYADGTAATARAEVRVDRRAVRDGEPAAPRKVQAVTAGRGSAAGDVRLTWRAPRRADVQSWRVYDRRGGLVAIVPGQARTALLTGVPAGAGLVRMAATNAAGTSARVAVRLP